MAIRLRSFYSCYWNQQPKVNTSWNVTIRNWLLKFCFLMYKYHLMWLFFFSFFLSLWKHTFAINGCEQNTHTRTHTKWIFRHSPSWFQEWQPPRAAAKRLERAKEARGSTRAHAPPQGFIPLLTGLIHILYPTPVRSIKPPSSPPAATNCQLDVPCSGAIVEGGGHWSGGGQSNCR